MLSLSSKSILLSLGPKNHMLSRHWLDRPFSEAIRECVPRDHGCKLRMAVPLTKNMTTKLAACTIEAMGLLACCSLSRTRAICVGRVCLQPVCLAISTRLVIVRLLVAW